MSEAGLSRAERADAEFAERLSAGLGEPVVAWCVGQSEAIREQGGIPMGLLGGLLARVVRPQSPSIASAGCQRNWHLR